MIGLLLWLAAAAAQPSFDCARARGAIEPAICASEELAALDREEARLYRLALAGAPTRQQSLVARQRRFLDERDECGGSYEPLGECVRNAYLGDIADLRRLSAAGRDRDGPSSGPLHFRCDGDYPDIYVTLFALSPRQAYVSVPSVNEGQPMVAGNAGALYVGRYATGWTYDPAARRVRIDARICLEATP
ncbi:MAG: DUF1311 domain-containing protein [Sphingomonadaceae bacterium]|nr:DUF1311 domain-containing protein [Sphingomonadaceae bacterium]